jgi:amidohydrolase
MIGVEGLDAAIARANGDLIALRRDLHRHPELSRHEFETTRKLAAQLAEMGLEVHVRPEGIGLFADLTPAGFNHGRTVAIRADIDALPIIEATELPYASQNAGVMHACGHDMHTACAMGAAVALSAQRDSLPGRVRFFFQHSEEVAPGGADELVDFGCMRGVDYVLGLHVDPVLEVGTVGIKDGPMTASADAFDLEVRGRGGHAARPHHCVDPVFVATQIATGLYQAAGRAFDARDPVVISIASVSAGDGYNVIPDTATLRGTVRTLSPATRRLIEPLFRRIAGGVCGMYGAEYHLETHLGAPSIDNSVLVADHIRAAARQVLGPDAVEEIPLPSMGAEDFSYYLELAPGAMFRLGTKGHGGDECYLHSPHFAPDEKALAFGARILARAAVSLLSSD